MEPDEDLLLDRFGERDLEGERRRLDDLDLLRLLGDLEDDLLLFRFGDEDDLRRDEESGDFFLAKELLSVDFELDLCAELLARVVSFEDEGSGAEADTGAFGSETSLFSSVSGTGMSALITFGKIDIGLTTPIWLFVGTAVSNTEESFLSLAICAALPS